MSSNLAVDAPSRELALPETSSYSVHVLVAAVWSPWRRTEIPSRNRREPTQPRSYRQHDRAVSAAAPVRAGTRWTRAACLCRYRLGEVPRIKRRDGLQSLRQACRLGITLSKKRSICRLASPVYPFTTRYYWRYRVHASAAAHDFSLSTPLPGEPAEPEEVDILTNGEAPPSDPNVPF